MKGVTVAILVNVIAWRRCQRRAGLLMASRFCATGDAEELFPLHHEVC